MPLIPWHSPHSIDTVIIGNGPSALILSYILNGHIPYYANHHHDQHLDDRFSEHPCLLDVNPSVYDHLRSSLKYSTQALPFNVLLDTLTRPDGDFSEISTSCIRWQYSPELAVTHVVYGDSPHAGGQWADDSVHTLPSIETLSYAEQLSLPGYSIADFWQDSTGEPLPELVRPSRATYAEYLAAYPKAVGIESNIKTSQTVSGITRTRDGFHIASHCLDTTYLVLASGTFNTSLAPPLSLWPMAPANDIAGSVLIVGSGFTAADLIISTPAQKRIIHVFKWDPENRPSPLKACHAQAYPEYAWVYRQMKLAAARQGYENARTKPAKLKNLPASSAFAQRDWTSAYAGFANATLVPKDADNLPNGVASASTAPSLESTTHEICITSPGQAEPATYPVEALHYAAGRRGTLSYLSPSLLAEVLPSGLERDEEAQNKLRRTNDSDPWTGDSDSPLPSHQPSLSDLRSVRTPGSTSNGGAFSGTVSNGLALLPSTITAASSSYSALPSKKQSNSHPTAIVSGHTLRPRIEASPDCDLELAPGVFVIGSLTGDNLVRYATGGCCQVAGKIMGRHVS